MLIDDVPQPGRSFAVVEMLRRCALVAASCALVIAVAYGQGFDETEERIHIAAANMEDAIVVDCQLPGKLRRLGGTRTYLTPGRLIRTSAIVCRTRGGEYTLGDLASGTLSLQRWMEPAKNGDAQAQYFVARIHATGMDNVAINYLEAARWYQMAADQGHDEAQQELGFLYEQGLGVEKDVLMGLNLQREASGLGENLDYAYKIDDAEARATRLQLQLGEANDALRQAQVVVRDSEAQFEAARADATELKLEIVALVAELDTARRAGTNGTQSRVQILESELHLAREQLETSQATIVELETQRESVQRNLLVQLAGGQAAKLELRELRARTTQSEQQVNAVSAELAEAEQRLIQSEEEIRQLQTALREQTEEIATERRLMLQASSKSDSDSAALVAVREAELESMVARVASLEAALVIAERQLAESADNSADTELLQHQVEQLQTRFDANVEAMSGEQERLERSRTATQEELDTLREDSTRDLATRESEIQAQRRQIETLTAEADRLRSRVESLQSQQAGLTQDADAESARLQAELRESTQQAVKLRSSYDAAKTEKAVLEAQLASLQLELQERARIDRQEDAQKLVLLEAEVQSARSTINTQALRMADLEQQIEARDAQVAELRKQTDVPPAPPVEFSDAVAVLELARSPDVLKIGRFRALLIANEDYRYMKPLTTPVRDAREIEKLLISRYDFDTEVLINATDDEVMRKLHQYANTLTEDDNLLIYYAGRGSIPDGIPERAYWLGVDADPSLPNTWLLAEHVSDKIREIEAKRILLVTDSCFSQRSVRRVTTSVGVGLEPERFKLLAQFQSRYVLTSGANVPVYDENGDRTHSLFAKLFMEILRQNANVLSGEMLSYEMSQRVRESIEDPQRAMPTYSSLQGAGHKAGDFFFIPQQPKLVASVGSILDSA